MDPHSSQWRSLGEPAGPGEEEALAAIRALLPDDAVTHAWANVSFVDLQGRTAEVDLLLLSRVGFFLVELKQSRFMRNGRAVRVRDLLKEGVLT